MLFRGLHTEGRRKSELRFGLLRALKRGETKLRRGVWVDANSQNRVLDSF